MPRVVFEEQGLGGDIGDLVSNVAGGLLQGYGGQILTQRERQQSQQEQAFGNPYQRVRRAALWNSMPEDVRGAPNAALYQELIAGGADPRTVLDTHRELSSDPAYGDAKTKASREAALKAAIGAGYVDANDQAGAEAFRRGETTIGQQWTRKKAQTEKDAEEKRQRDEKLADEKRRRDQGLSDDKTKRDELKARAGQVAKELGVGQPTPPAAVPTWGGGMVPTGTMPIPATPGTEFSDPQDVVHVAGERRLRQTAEVNAADKTADNQLQARKADINAQRVQAYIEHLQQKDAPPSDEEIDQVAELMQESNPSITLRKARADAKLAVQYKIKPPAQRPPTASAAAWAAQSEIEALQAQGQQMLRDPDPDTQQRGQALLAQAQQKRQAYAQQFGSALPPQGSGGAAPAQPQDPAATAAQMTDEQLKALITR